MEYALKKDELFVPRNYIGICCRSEVCFAWNKVQKGREVKEVKEDTIIEKLTY